MLFLKVVGSAFIMGSGLLARQLQARQRRREREALWELLFSLRRLGEEVRIARTPLPALLRDLAKECGSETSTFFQTVSDAAGRGEGLVRAWRDGAERLPLSDGSRAALLELGGSLRGDERSVCSAAALAVARLEREWETAEQRRPEEEKRATALYLSGAALLVILLL